MRQSPQLESAWTAVKANVLPMLVLWALAVALAVGYFWIPGVAALLEPLRIWQGKHEIVGAFVGRVFFCGLVPGVFLLTVKSLRPKRPVATVIAQSLWCGGGGIVYVFLFRWMALWFGDGPEVATLLKKTAFDMFVWSVFVMIPLNAVFFFWVGHDLSWVQTHAAWPQRFLREQIVPNYLVNWCIWIPVMIVVYSFPLTLQIHISGLAGSLWALVSFSVGARKARHRASA